MRSIGTAMQFSLAQFSLAAWTPVTLIKSFAVPVDEFQREEYCHPFEAFFSPSLSKKQLMRKCGNWWTVPLSATFEQTIWTARVNQPVTRISTSTGERGTEVHCTAHLYSTLSSNLTTVNGHARIYLHAMCNGGVARSWPLKSRWNCCIIHIFLLIMITSR